VRWKTEAALLAAALAAAAPPGLADDEGSIRAKSRGELSLESRAFSDDDDSRTQDAGLGLFGRFEWQLKSGEYEARLRGFGRVDSQDSKRSLAAVEEAFAQWKRERLRVRVGYDVVNWSATEAFHPADVLNARNLDSDIENFEKLGEPMVAVQWGLSETTSLQALFMPMYVDSVYPSPHSRLNLGPPGTDLQDRARRFDRKGDFTRGKSGTQFALRLQQTIGSAEVSVHYLEHLDRLQGLPVLDLGSLQPALVFQTQRQAGFTYQQAFENGVLAKVEAARNTFVQPRDPAAAAREANIAFAGEPFPDRDHDLLAAGLEYAVEHGWGTSTLVLEGQAIRGVDRQFWPTLTLFPRNVLLGYRLAFSTADSRELRVAFIANVDQPAQKFLNIAWEQRLGDQVKLRLGARFFRGADVATPIGFDALSRGDHVFANLDYYF
jgi:hypothetical protein